MKPISLPTHIKSRAFFGAVAATFFCAMPVAAGDLLFQLTSPIYNESIAIGRITSKQADLITFERNSVLLGKRIPRTVYITDFEPDQVEALSSEDYAVLSLRKGHDGKNYHLNYSAFKTNTDKPSGATILSGPLAGADLEAYNWFVNSCGRDKDFAFDYSGTNKKILVKDSDGQQRVISTSKGDKWNRTIDPPMCESAGRSWWYSLLGWFGAA